MTPNEAFEFINQLFLSNRKASLDECYKTLVRGIWENKTYQQISDEYDWSHQHLKDTGSQLFKDFKEITGFGSTKKSFKNALESFYLQNNQQKAIVHESQGIVVAKNNLSNNPFKPLTGIIDDPALFFNRERNLRSIFELLNSRSSVAIIGDRQIGKSSLLKAIERQAQQQLYSRRQPIYLNLQSIENEDDFYSYWRYRTDVL
ncbi:MAG: hypothetical protein SW833_19830 [Cyanobacteriota bacterium]|nr:hypothetical protein [Cyanobacteriota bacterium]